MLNGLTKTCSALIDCFNFSISFTILLSETQTLETKTQATRNVGLPLDIVL